MEICTEVFIVLLLFVISSCSFHQIEDKIASYTVAQFLYTHNRWQESWPFSDNNTKIL